ncbi:MAG: acyltransferase [Sphaerochaeta sp.]|nr:acyltransferase [Sphaerochaeta sp.]
MVEMGDDTMRSNKNIGLNYLKLLLTLFVVLHHTILAYLPGGPGVTVDDPDNVTGFMYIAVYFDQFFMYTFFFLSGLFTYDSLRRRGRKNYILHRLAKFGTVFIIGTYLFNPTTFYLMEFAKGTEWWIQYASLRTYTSYMIDVGLYLHPAQHLWFLWVLLAFNVIVTVIDSLYPDLLDHRYAFRSVPVTGMVIFVIMSVGYMLVGSFAGYSFVNIWGPFNIQVSRVIPYFIMFTVGFFIGRPSLYTSGSAADEGVKARNILKSKASPSVWSAVWLVLGLGMSLLSIAIPLSRQGLFAWLGPMAAAIMGSVGYVTLFDCITRENKVVTFLSAHAFGVYVFHYGFVAILQGLFYHISLSGVIKAVLVFAGAVILSLVLTVLLRKTKPGRYFL